MYPRSPRYTPHHAQYLAHRLTLRGPGPEAVARSLASSRIDLRPHQVEATLFALSSPLAKGALLADEVGLGKTIEGGLVIAQFWAERRRLILLIVPSVLQAQWCVELHGKFGLPGVILDRTALRRGGGLQKLARGDAVVVVSIDFAARYAVDIAAVAWDLVVIDEAHWMRGLWNSSRAQRARAVQTAVGGRFTLLLSATPIQNALPDLGALLSVIDRDLFSDADAFRALYGNRTASASQVQALRKRIAPMVRRSLRRDLQKHVLYTKRVVHTLDFTPSDREQELYERLSAYLSSETLAFGARPSALLLIAARKIMGSSTAAIAGFLQTVIVRLRRKQMLTEEALIKDLDGALTHDNDGSADNGDAETVIGPPGEAATAAAFAAEIKMLEDCCSLAQAIEDDSKARALIAALPDLLERQAREGQPGKAVIFTESRRTQDYLAKRLALNGHAGRIVLLNGSNDDPGSQQIYRAWLAARAGSEAVSGNRTADMKAAIVEAFRGDGKTLLISTESGAEGLNLQFCSLLINYDLPWNPQRIEQRIGRCHRYGQRRDVVVVNMLNRRNHAEARVYELLRQKFALFEESLGASDAVLSAIGDGFGLEQQITRLLEGCRTREELDAAFDHFEQELEETLGREMAATRATILDHLDRDVAALLLAPEGEVADRLLTGHEQRLLTLVRAELPRATFAPEDPRRFRHRGTVYTTDWRAADREPRWHFLRLGEGRLADELIRRAKERDLRPVGLRFSYSAYRAAGQAQLADVQRLRGRGGWMSLSLLSCESASLTRERLLAVAPPDRGRALHPETVERLFLLPAQTFGFSERSWPGARMTALEDLALAKAHNELRHENAAWLDQEEQGLHAARSAAQAGSRARLDDLERSIRSARRDLDRARSAEGCSAQAQAQLKARVLGLLREVMETCLTGLQDGTALDRQLRERRQASARLLAFEPQVRRLFRLRWEVVD